MEDSVLQNADREHAFVLGSDFRSDPRPALQRVGDEIAMRQHRAFWLAGDGQPRLVSRHSRTVGRPRWPRAGHL